MLALLLLGIAQGFRHAIEPDHLAAVAAIAGRDPRPSAAARVGAWWGLGHAATLASFAGGLGALGTFVPASVESLLERLVGVVLIVLGALAVRRAFDDHAHGDAQGFVHAHVHGDAREHVHVGPGALALRPFAVGVVHGLAGSGALAGVLIATVPEDLARVAAAAAFGLGALLGMAAISGLAGAGLARYATTPGAHRLVGGVSGAVSLGVGVMWVVA